MNDAIVAKQITKRYEHHVALNSVSLTIPENCIYGLLGPNGAGKTTFIRILTQIIQADEGTISVYGNPLHGDHMHKMGYLPEERGLFKKLKVGEQLVYLARLKGLSKTDAISKSKFWLDKLGAANWWGKSVEDLSKGMAQKIQFINTVLHDPQFIIFDEPFSGFDPVNVEMISQEILALKEKGVSMMISTHRMETVENLCDHVAFIHKAQKILEGNKKSVKENFRTHTFLVEHRKNLTISLDENFEMIKQTQGEDNIWSTQIRILKNEEPNALIRELMKEVEIIRFQEVIPSMNDIFIQLVKEKG